MSSASCAIKGASALARSTRPNDKGRASGLFMGFPRPLSSDQLRDMLVHLAARIKMGGVSAFAASPATFCIAEKKPWPRLAVIWQVSRGACRKALERFSAIHLERGDEGFLRDVDLAELPHLLLAFLLLLQKLAFARDVAAVAFGGDVLAQRAHGFARNDLASDRGLDRNLEHVRRDQLLHLLDHGAAAAFRAGAVNQHRERIHRLAPDEGLALDAIGRLVVGGMIVERNGALGNPLEGGVT